MIMSDEEIKIQYRDAKKKQAQVGILADLNGVPKKEMVAKLKSLGILESKPAEIDSEFGQKCIDLYKQGFGDAEIAEAIGVQKADIVSWRKAIGYKANYPKHPKPRETKPKEEKPVKPEDGISLKDRAALAHALAFDCVNSVEDREDPAERAGYAEATLKAIHFILYYR